MVNELIARRRGMVGSAVLPYDAEIEYLQSSGTQYIDTGIIQRGRNMEFVLDVQWTGNDVQQFESFFAYMAPNAITPRCGIHKYVSTWMFGTNVTRSTSVVLNGNRHRIQLIGIPAENKDILYIDGAMVDEVSTTAEHLADNLITFFLGARNRGGSVDNPASARFYGLNFKKFADAGHTTITQEWNLIPVRIGQVGYMYDTVSGDLLGNCGSGSFILGNDK